MARDSGKNIQLIISVFEQNIANSKRQVEAAIVVKDWVRALINQTKVDTATELLEVVKALGIKRVNSEKMPEVCSL